MGHKAWTGEGRNKSSRRKFCLELRKMGPYETEEMEEKKVSELAVS